MYLSNIEIEHRTSKSYEILLIRSMFDAMHSMFDASIRYSMLAFDIRCWDSIFNVGIRCSMLVFDVGIRCSMLAFDTFDSCNILNIE